MIKLHKNVTQRKRGFMKKLLLLMVVLFCFNVTANAATTVIENYDAKKLKNDIIGIYALRGSVVESNKLDEYSFSVRSNYLTLWSGYQFKKTFTIVPNGKNCILSLVNNSLIWPYDVKELYVLEKELKGGYTYGLNYFIKLKAKPNKYYMSDGIDSNGTPTRISNSNDAESVYFYNVVPKSTIRGPRLISTSHSAKEQGLKSKYRIVEINDKHINKYNSDDLWTLLNPTKAGQTIKIGYKEKTGGKVKHVTLQSKYQKPILENL